MAIAAILIFTILVLIFLLIFLVKRKLSYWKNHGIAHNKPSLLVGNFQGVKKTYSMSEIMTATYEKFKGTGPFCGFYFIHRPTVVVLDTELVKNVFIRDFHNFTDRGLFHNEEDDPLTGRLFLLDGAKWKAMRQKLTPTFSTGKMKFMYPLIQKEANTLIEVINNLKEKDEVIELKELLARFTTDVIGSCVFGINCQSLKNPNAEFRVMGKRSLEENRHGKLLTAFMKGFPDLARKLHMRLLPDDITNFYIRIVKEILEYRQEHNIKTNDFISILSDLNNKKDDEASKLTIEQMAAQAFVFFLGGFETTSSTIGHALYELALHENIQDKLREEINEVMERETDFSYESMHQMEYMGQVIAETLRKYPVIPVIIRKALNDYMVPGHPKYVIKKDMLAIIPVYAIHHDPDYYPEPHIFDPERFDAAAIRQRDSIKYLPFGDGPRNCIGLRFGLMQTRVGLAYLLRHFKFSVCEKTEIPIEWNKEAPLLTTKNGIYLRVERV